MELFRINNGEWISDRHMLKLDVKNFRFIDTNNDKTYPAPKEIQSRIKEYWTEKGNNDFRWCLKEDVLALLKEAKII
ncbi:MAG: hypothetical protein LBS55_06325 [Prevotellaceae bacterium]|jgi:hypothetical protein|nr:hypothetical protein [Prevotellaceae bacterium]